MSKIVHYFTQTLALTLYIMEDISSLSNHNAH